MRILFGILAISALPSFAFAQDFRFDPERLLASLSKGDPSSLEYMLADDAELGLRLPEKSGPSSASEIVQNLKNCSVIKSDWRAGVYPIEYRIEYNCTGRAYRTILSLVVDEGLIASGNYYAHLPPPPLLPLSVPTTSPRSGDNG